MRKQLILGIFLLLIPTYAFAFGTMIVMAVMGVTTYGAMTAGMMVAAFAINMVVSAIISKALAPDINQPTGSSPPNMGNRQQVVPATNNKLDVIYGSAYVGGTVIDMSISNDNQQMYFVLALSEVTGINGTPDTFTFGDVYWGGKQVVFQGNGYTVASLLDQSTGISDTTVDGKIEFFFYSNGSSSPTNSAQTAIQVMQTSGLVYQWDATKVMTDTAFVIIHLSYNQDAGVTGLQQTRFQVINSRDSTGDVFNDYLLNTRYGAAIPSTQIDTTSLDALTAYGDENFTYIPYTGGSATQARFKFNGVVNTSRSIMSNLQDMASCCDCLIKYTEVTAKWGVVVQSPAYTVSMDLNDSNIISGITITPIDIASSFNIAEVKFADNTAQDTFASSIFDLAVINPSLMYPNEPINKQSISLPLVNNSITAQYLANRFLEAAREDLIVQLSINYIGLQLDAGDIVTITNVNYGWEDKLFRIQKVTQQFGDDGKVTAQLSLMEYNPTIYDDISITQFTPAPNTGIGDPIFFGTVPAPSIEAEYPANAVPSFSVQVTTSSSGITQYAEVWYSAFSSPTTEQRIFAGTSEIQSNGNPWGINFNLPLISLSGITAGNWYFFTRMVNALGTSIFSPASSVFNWRPTTYQYINRYLSIAYANSADGSVDFTTDPRNTTYYGLFSNTTATPSIIYTDYTWYLADPAFATDNYVLFANRQNRLVSLSVGNAAYLGIGGAFVPTETSIYDATLWNGLEDGTNYIDLDMRTGQLTKVGTSSVSSADGLLSVSNNTAGTMIVSLQKFLNFGSGVYSKTVAPVDLTIDIFGRVVGFTQQDNFYFTETVFVATASQTTFSVTHIEGQVLVFLDGVLVNLSDYTETSTTIVMNTGAAVGQIIVVLNMRAVSTDDYYELLDITIVSNTSTSITYGSLPYQKIVAGDLLSFANTGSPATYTVSTINYTTKVITFTGVISGATAGNSVYRFRAASSEYTPFSRWTETFTAVSSFIPTDYLINSGFEQIYINGCQFNEIDYNLADNEMNGFPAPITGEADIIQFSSNNLGVPCSNITNSVAYSISGALTYPFDSNPLAMAVYANGVILVKPYDYTATTIAYNLVTAFPNNFTLLNQQTFARIGAA